MNAEGRQAFACHRSVLVGLIGEGITGSRMPALHEAEGAAQGLTYIYRLLDLAGRPGAAGDLPGLLALARLAGFAGLNVTHPFKQAIIQHLDALSPDAAALQAVNTVVFADGVAIGHNTDWSGFAESFRRELGDVARRRVVLLGAGGAGAAVAHALLRLDVAAIRIVDSDPARAGRLAEALRTRFGPDRATMSGADAIGEADGVVNATPVGMDKYPGLPISLELLRPGLWVADIIYFPFETALLRAARALGCRTMGGGGMAVFQAVEAFRLFTGIAPDAGRMLENFAAM